MIMSNGSDISRIVDCVLGHLSQVASCSARALPEPWVVRPRVDTRTTRRSEACLIGLRFAGLSPDGGLVEIIELSDHPFFVATQFHPELKSRPTRPHPLFAAFIGAARTRALDRAKTVGLESASDLAPVELK